MRTIICHGFLALVLGANTFARSAVADTFGSGANSFQIDFVTIGNPGNPPDANPNPAGAVAYEYRIGKYEVSEQMIDKANAEGALGVTKDTRGPDYPATSISWFEAAKFVNWLNASAGSPVAYKFDAGGNFQLWQPLDPGYDPNNLYRNKLAKYFLPSINEWHKAAYYDPVAGHYWDYPTGSDSVPDGIDFVGDPNFEAVFDDGAFNPDPNIITDVGLPSPFGTFGQGGNVEEWDETAVDFVNNAPNEGRIFRGGSWSFHSTTLSASNLAGLSPQGESEIIGFRIVSIVPEPELLHLSGILLGALIVLARLRRPIRHIYPIR